MTDNEALNMVDNAIKSDFIGKCNVGHDLAEALGIVVGVATNAIKNSEADGWIPIETEEDLPKEGGWYLATVEYVDSASGELKRYTSELYFSTEFQEFPCQENVIAWKPLPKPYTESEEGSAE